MAGPSAIGPQGLKWNPNAPTQNRAIYHAPRTDEYADVVELSIQTNKEKSIDLLTDAVISFHPYLADLGREAVRKIVAKYVKDADKDGYYEFDCKRAAQDFTKAVEPGFLARWGGAKARVYTSQELYDYLIRTSLSNNIRFNVFFEDEVTNYAKTATGKIDFFYALGFFEKDFNPLDPHAVAQRLFEWGTDEGLFETKDGEVVFNEDGSPRFVSAYSAERFFGAWQAYFKTFLAPDFLNGSHGPQSDMDDDFQATAATAKGLAKTTETYIVKDKTTVRVNRVKVDCAGYEAYAHAMANYLDFPASSVFAVVLMDGEAAGHAVTGLTVTAGGSEKYILFNNGTLCYSTVPIKEFGGLQYAASQAIQRSMPGASVAYVSEHINAFSASFSKYALITDKKSIESLAVLTNPPVGTDGLAYILNLSSPDFRTYVDKHTFKTYFAESAVKTGNFKLDPPKNKILAKDAPINVLLTFPLGSVGHAHGLYRLVQEGREEEAYSDLHKKMVAAEKEQLDSQIKQLNTLNYEELSFPLELTITTYENVSKVASEPNLMPRIKIHKFKDAEELKAFVGEKIKSLEAKKREVILASYTPAEE